MKVTLSTVEDITMCDNLDCESVMMVDDRCVVVTDEDGDEHVYCCAQCADEDLCITIVI